MAEITLTIPESPDQLLETLNDPKVVQALMADPQKNLTSFLTQYTAATASPSMTLDGEEQQKRILNELLEDNGVFNLKKRPPMDAASARQMAYNGGQDLAWFKGNPLTSMNPMRKAMALSLYEQEAPGAVMDGNFARMAHYYKGIDWQSIAGRFDRNLSDAQLKVLGESQGDAGGFLVPEEFRVQLLALALETAIMRPRAMVIPMTTLKVRIPAIRDTSHATTVFGGMQFFWTPEAGSITVSQPTFSLNHKP